MKDAIDFAEWILKNGYKNNGSGKWLKTSWAINLTGKQNDFYTTKELYKIFKPV